MRKQLDSSVFQANGIVIICIFFAMFFLHGICLADNDAIHWNNQGVKRLNMGDYDMAITHFSKAILLDRQMSLAWYHRGYTYAIKGQYKKATDDFSQAISIKPGYVKAYINRGHAWSDMGKPNPAISDYKKAVTLAPDQPEGYANLGLVYNDIEDYQNSIESYNKAVELAPNQATYRFNRGRIYHNMEKYTQAIKDYSAYIQSQPNNAKVFFYRSQAYEALAKGEQALSDAKKAVQLAPGNEKYQLRVSFLKAIVTLPPKTKTGSNTDIHKNNTLSEETTESQSSSHPGLARHLFQQAARDMARFKSSGNAAHFQTALFHIHSAIDIEPDQSEYWFFLGLLYAQLKTDRGALIKATDAFIQAIEINPDHGRAQLLLAQTLHEQGQFLTAIEQYKFLIKKDPAMATGIVLAPLSTCYLASGRLDEGIFYLKKLSASFPLSSPVKTSLAILLKQNGDINKAQQHLNDIIKNRMGTTAEQEYAQTLLNKWAKEVS